MSDTPDTQAPAEQPAEATTDTAPETTEAPAADAATAPAESTAPAASTDAPAEETTEAPAESAAETTDGEEGTTDASRTGFVPGGKPGEACTCPDGRPGTIHVFAGNPPVCLPNQG